MESNCWLGSADIVTVGLAVAVGLADWAAGFVDVVVVDRPGDDLCPMNANATTATIATTTVAATPTMIQGVRLRLTGAGWGGCWGGAHASGGWLGPPVEGGHDGGGG